METPVALPWHGHIPDACWLFCLVNWVNTAGNMTAHFCLSSLRSTVARSFFSSTCSPSSLVIVSLCLTTSSVVSVIFWSVSSSSFSSSLVTATVVSSWDSICLTSFEVDEVTGLSFPLNGATLFGASPSFGLSPFLSPSFSSFFSSSFSSFFS